MHRNPEGRAGAESRPGDFDDWTYEWLSRAIEEQDRRRAAILQGTCDLAKEGRRQFHRKSTYSL